MTTEQEQAKLELTMLDRYQVICYHEGKWVFLGRPKATREEAELLVQQYEVALDSKIIWAITKAVTIDCSLLHTPSGDQL